jgi:hypothetical protein
LVLWLVATLLLGIAFLGMEGHDFATMAADHATPDRVDQRQEDLADEKRRSPIASRGNSDRAAPNMARENLVDDGPDDRAHREREAGDEHDQRRQCHDPGRARRSRGRGGGARGPYRPTVGADNWPMQGGPPKPLFVRRS